MCKSVSNVVVIYVLVIYVSALDVIVVLPFDRLNFSTSGQRILTTGRIAYRADTEY